MGVGIHGRYITADEWQQQYVFKRELMLERGFKQVEPIEFYRDLFPEGSLQAKGELSCGKGNVIVSQIREEDDTEKSRQWVATDDLQMINKAIGDKFGLIGPLSYFGKKNLKQNAHELFAIAVDLDYVHLQQLKNLLKQFDRGVQLTPTYLVSSGRGLHFYYFLEEPVPMYKHVSKVLSDLKQALTNRLWNDTSSLKGEKQDIDKAGIFQNFRAVGSKSKIGDGFPVIAFKMCDNRYTLEQIRDGIPGCKIPVEKVYQLPEYEIKKRGINLEQAKELWPDWYEERIVQGKPAGKQWVIKRDLYEWWKRTIQEQVKAGGRYYSLYALVCYGRKCYIPTDEIKRDAWSFYELLDSRTDDELNHFKKSDVEAALKQLKEPLAYRCTREFIEDNCKVVIPKNKRNYRKRDTTHQAYRRGLKALKKQLGEEVKEGRPIGSGTAQAKVQQYRAEHPEANVTDVARALGISRPTVYKWWDV